MPASRCNEMKYTFCGFAVHLLVIAAIISCTLASAYAAQADKAYSMAAHDMSTMSGMPPSSIEDMSAIDGMTSMQQAASSESRTPIPELTDADRQAAFPDVDGHEVHDNSVHWYLLVDQLEWQKNNDTNGLGWDLSSWAGGDIDRLWLRSEGEAHDGKTESAEIQILWGHAISPWWDGVIGIRQDFKPVKAKSWIAAGLQGAALYNFETELTAFVGQQGSTALRLETEYDVLLTNQLILQPALEANFYGKDDEAREIGKGLSSTEFSLRLRYEVKREFAPYVGVSWIQLYGNTADMVVREGEKDNEVSFLLGARVWF